MHIRLVGLSHNSAPLEVRERVSFSKEQLADALPRPNALTGEGVIQSTCDGTEVYTVSEHPAKIVEQTPGFLAKYRCPRTPPDLEPAHLEVVEALTRSTVNKLLHEPTALLRQHPDKPQLQAARDLFRLWDDS